MVKDRKRHRYSKGVDVHFKLVCTGRGTHNSAELGHFRDNRYGQEYTPTVETYVEDGVEHELTVEQQLTIFSLGSASRGHRWASDKTERASVFGKNPAGDPKARLHCPRCGRDEQFTEKRFDRLADAIEQARGERVGISLDISWLDDYLDHQ